LFRWFQVKVKITPRRKTDLTEADAVETKVTQRFKMERSTDLKAQPIGDLKLTKGVKAKTRTNLVSCEPADVKATKRSNLITYIRLDAFYRAPIEILKKLRSFSHATLDQAPTETIPEVSKELHTKSKAEFNKAYPEYTKVNTKIKTKSSMIVGQTGSSDIAVKCELPKLDCTAVMDYWFIPEIDEDGVLHIKQVSSAVINGDTLEVR
jgi:hypothetical protein